MVTVHKGKSLSVVSFLSALNIYHVVFVDEGQMPNSFIGVWFE